MKCRRAYICLHTSTELRSTEVGQVVTERVRVHSDSAEFTSTCDNDARQDYSYRKQKRAMHRLGSSDSSPCART